MNQNLEYLDKQIQEQMTLLEETKRKSSSLPMNDPEQSGLRLQIMLQEEKLSTLTDMYNSLIHQLEPYAAELIEDAEHTNEEVMTASLTHEAKVEECEQAIGEWEDQVKQHEDFGNHRMSSEELLAKIDAEAKKWKETTPLTWEEYVKGLDNTELQRSFDELHKTVKSMHPGFIDMQKENIKKMKQKLNSVKETVSTAKDAYIEAAKATTACAMDNVQGALSQIAQTAGNTASRVRQFAADAYINTMNTANTAVDNMKQTARNAKKWLQTMYYKTMDVFTLGAYTQFVNQIPDHQFYQAINTLSAKEQDKYINWRECLKQANANPYLWKQGHAPIDAIQNKAAQIKSEYQTFKADMKQAITEEKQAIQKEWQTFKSDIAQAKQDFVTSMKKDIQTAKLILDTPNLMIEASAMEVKATFANAITKAYEFGANRIENKIKGLYVADKQLFDLVEKQRDIIQNLKAPGIPRTPEKFEHSEEYKIYQKQKENLLSIMPSVSIEKTKEQLQQAVDDIDKFLAKEDQNIKNAIADQKQEFLNTYTTMASAYEADFQKLENTRSKLSKCTEKLEKIKGKMKHMEDLSNTYRKEEQKINQQIDNNLEKIEEAFGRD